MKQTLRLALIILLVLLAKLYHCTVMHGSERLSILKITSAESGGSKYLDGLVFPSTPANDLAAIAVSGNQNPIVGTEEIYEVSVLNYGSAMQDSYTVQLCSAEGLELATAAGVAVAPGLTVRIPLSLAVLNNNQTYIYGKVILPLDANPDNDSSPLLSICPIPAEAIGISVGIGNQTQRIPMDMNYKSSLFETIYLAEELSCISGNISGIRFYNSFTSNISQIPTQVWLGTTDLNNLEAGWIPASQLYQVFNGLVDYPSGQNVINLSFPVPFAYNGVQNLVLMVHRPMDTVYYPSSNVFVTQTLGSTRSRKVQSDTYIYNPVSPPQTSTLYGRYPKTTFIVIPDAFGSISGAVMDNLGNPLAETQVQILNTEYTAYTDASGTFSFPNLPVGLYNLSFFKHGYFSAEHEVSLTQNEQETLAVTLTPMPVVNVSGRVIDAADGSVISYASISLVGYEDYQTTMQENGFFVINGVYANQNYSYEISALGYTPITGIVEIGAENYLWADLILCEFPWQPCNVIAQTEGEPVSVVINWELSFPANKSRQPPTLHSRNAPRILQGYQVWRLRSEVQNQPENWVLLTPQPILQSSFVDLQWSLLAEGDWFWAVQAIYSGNVLSQIAFSNPLYKASELGALIGIVRDANHNPISQAMIVTETGQVATNEQGAYYLVLPAGLHSVSVSAAGYQPVTCDGVEVLPWQNTQLDFTLNPVSLAEDNLPAAETRLHSIYPNPFAERSNVSFSLKTPGSVMVEIYNLKGQLVQRKQHPARTSGKHSLEISATDSQGIKLPSGIYLCRFVAGSYTQTQKLLIIH